MKELTLREKQILTFASVVAKSSILFVKKEYKLPKDWDVLLKFDFSEKRTRSWGGINKEGIPFVSLSLNELLTKNILHFQEYNHIDNNEHVGSVKNISWKKYIICLFLHELSHTIQYSLCKKDYNVPHGKYWQKIYKKLRKRFYKRKIVISNDFFINVKKNKFLFSSNL